MTKLMTTIALAVAGCAACVGQAIPAASQPEPRYEVFGGYSLLRGDMGTLYRPQGWALGMTTRFNPYVGLDAGLVGNTPVPADDGRKTSMSILMVGPRLSLPLHRFTLSANAGVGLTRWERAGWHSSVDCPPGEPIRLAWEGGMGVDFRVLPKVSLRLLQIDYMRTRYFSGQNGVFTTGVIYAFGRR
jgi:opacity protein-like surface antigen